jgi:anti-sigma-K factor RskA
VNVQEYISSGIVESYVFGLANQEEQAEFERMCAAYPEVKAARETFELLLEKQALSQAVEPPADLKNKIFSNIGIEPAPQAKRFQFPKSQLVQPPAPVVKMGWFRFLAAASIVLLLVSTALNFYFFSQYREYSSKYDQLVSNQNQLASANQVLQTKLQDYQSALSMMKDPQMAIVKMPVVPTSPDPSSLATVYWDTRSKDVYLLINSLPAPSGDKQFQLWALVDGKPVDAGVFDIKDGLSFVKMKNIPKAQAFAITLEKRGGSTSPTMQAMYVLGKVTG